MPGTLPPDRQSPGSRLLTALLVTLTIAGVTLMAGGAAVAVYSNTPANQEGNPLAAVGVAVGAQIAVLGAIVTASCVTAIAVRRRRRR